MQLSPRNHPRACYSSTTQPPCTPHKHHHNIAHSRQPHNTTNKPAGPTQPSTTRTHTTLLGIASSAFLFRSFNHPLSFSFFSSLNVRRRAPFTTHHSTHFPATSTLHPLLLSPPVINPLQQNHYLISLLPIQPTTAPLYKPN